MIPLKDTVLIYHSSEDSCWVGHSLHTDIVGTGEHVVDALVDVIQGIQRLRELVARNPTIAEVQEAPEEIRRMAEEAIPLPPWAVDYAWQIACGECPELQIDVEPSSERRSLRGELTLVAE
jgi:hypothetical protein